MTRRLRLSNFAWACQRSAPAFLIGLFVALSAATTEGADRRPNFVVILGDNVGKDWFGCYGGDGGHTPQIDKLAASGVRFEHCYVTPLCSTSRAEILTGRYGFRTGWHTHHDAAIYGGGGLDWRRETTFARMLRDAGYATAIAGKWQINDLYEDTDALTRHGFDEHLVWTGALLGDGTADGRWKASLKAARDLESRYWNPVVFDNGRRRELNGRFGPDVYLEQLVEFMERHRDQPFLAYYAMPLVHVPPVTTPMSPNKGTNREAFIGMVHYLDHQIGQLVTALDRLGLREDTIVIFTTDNGTPAQYSGTAGGRPVPGGLGLLTENGLDVPLIVQCPGRVPEGRLSTRLADFSDILPTLADLAGTVLPRDTVIDGRSFAAEVGSRARRPAERDWVFTQLAETRVVRDRRYKLYSTGAFYNVDADPLEKKDLAESQDPVDLTARQRLKGVLAQLPPDSHLPFNPRSQQAFKLEEDRKKNRGQPSSK